MAPRKSSAHCYHCRYSFILARTGTHLFNEDTFGVSLYLGAVTNIPDTEANKMDKALVPTVLTFWWVNQSTNKVISEYKKGNEEDKTNYLRIRTQGLWERTQEAGVEGTALIRLSRTVSKTSVKINQPWEDLGWEEYRGRGRCKGPDFRLEHLSITGI